ncbi:hypothetical protein Q1695_004463 [Nippostrongylus brasiliensis]|nr:hypothetical protein Q1695_004463 [Nippostrongylus brasiliensis]
MIVVFPHIQIAAAEKESAERPRDKRLALHPSQWSLHLWPGGVVPYEIAPHYDSWERAVIMSGMSEFPKHTCISFRPRVAGDRYYLAINKYYDLERCFSYIGRQTSSFFRTREGNVETRMRLDPSCLRFNGRGTVMHELMHIIGFYHEHQRDDRDPRVRGDPRHYNYKIYPRSSTYYMGRYDPTSIMHYNFPGIVYPRSYFSVSDILRINTLYRCPARSPTTTVRPTWYPNWPPITTTTYRPPASPATQAVLTTRNTIYYTTRVTPYWTTTRAPWTQIWTTRRTPIDEEQISRNEIRRRMRRF